MIQKLSEKFCESKSDGKTDQPANDHFPDPVSHSLFQFGVFFLQVEVFDDLVQISALVAHIHSESDGVVNRDDRQDESNRKGARRNSLIIGDGGDKRNNETCVSGGHMAVADMLQRIAQVPAVLQGVENDLDRKNQKPNGNWQKKGIIF